MTTETAAPPKTVGPPKTKSQALRSYDVADFPALTGREEEWRFTPLDRLGELAKADAGTTPGRAEPRAQRAFRPAYASSTCSRGRQALGSILTPFDRISALAYGGSAQRSWSRSIGARSCPSRWSSDLIGGRVDRRPVRAYVHRRRRGRRGHDRAAVHRHRDTRRQRRGVDRRERESDAGHGHRLGSPTRYRRSTSSSGSAATRGSPTSRSRSAATWSASTPPSSTPTAAATPNCTASTSPAPASTSSTGCSSTTRSRTAAATSVTAARCRARTRTRSGSATC